MHRVAKVAAFLILAAVTIVLGFTYNRYRPVGPELLLNGDFSRGLEGWQISGPSGALAVEPPRTVRLQSDDPGRYVSLTQTVQDPGRFKLLELSGTIRTEAGGAGKQEWPKARLILSGYRLWASAGLCKDPSTSSCRQGPSACGARSLAGSWCPWSWGVPEICCAEP